ncbi:MAG: UvrD-helicase domain-containing protein, partial [Proteobacteria bacterium]|nr:UvrD-helicase domain-containing protein [Pseudomonadota bacterium]
PAVVFAGAGSGKTRIITTRIAWLIETGTLPWEILAVTFTNKAAREMRDRVLRLNPDAERSLVTTFHAACARWLREFAPELGFTSDFTIYDDTDSTSVIRKIMKSANFPIEKETTAAEFRAGINHAKTLGLFPSDGHREAALFRTFMPTAGVEIYRAYQETLALSNAMDFGDLIMNTLLLLRTNERVKNALTHRFKYVLVDEYQDTNRPQMELIEHLSSRHKNIFVVGDDDQSIYSWRGAVPANILEFDQIYPVAKVCKLEDNYRSTANIVNAAAAVVSHNKTRADKTLRTDNPSGELIDFRYETDAEFEAWWVAKQINIETALYPLDEIAVFYRTNSQSRLLEDAFRREQIPYQIYGAVRFYDRVEVKDIMAYLRLLVNPRDDVSFLRAMNTPSRGLGDSAEEAIAKASREREVTMWEAAKLLSVEGVPRLSTKLSVFIELMERLKVSLVSEPMESMIEIIAEATGYFPYLHKKFPDQASDKEDNVMELASAIADFASVEESPSIASWLQMITLSSEADGDTKGVSMMTLHMAKGLEYERVYLTGFEDGLLPHFNSTEDKSMVEEERRLLYVGMTRAKKKLSITAAYMRRTWGNTVANEVSRFLTEIPSKFMRILNDKGEAISETTGGEESLEAESFGATASKNKFKTSEKQIYEYDDELGPEGGLYEKGKSVSHPTYGTGTIEEVQANWGKPKVVVRFDDFGLRRVDPRHLELSL